MHYLTRFIVLILSCIFCTLSYTQSEERLASEIRKIIRFDTDITYDKTPGFMIGVLDQSNQYMIPFGTKEIDSTALLTSSDIFELGSLTKFFTALLLFELDKNNLLSINNPVNEYIPSDYQNEALAHVNIADLLSHTSGLPKLVRGIGIKETDADQPYINFSKDELLAFYSSLDSVQVGSYLYSHFGYALLEVVIEQVTDRSFAKAIQKYLCAPLDLHYTSASKATNITPGYSLSLNTAEPWIYKSFSGSFGLKSNLNDLMQLFNILLQDQASILSSSFNKTCEVMAATDYGKNMKVAAPWIVQQSRKGNLIYMHSGKTRGHHCFIGFVKETKTAVIVLSNSVYGTGDLGYLILRMVNDNWKRLN